jgi:hypothetical protein
MVTLSRSGIGLSTDVRGHTRTARGRKPIDPNRPREEIIIDLSDHEKLCARGEELTRIGTEASEKVEFIPAQLLPHNADLTSMSRQRLPLSARLFNWGGFVGRAADRIPQRSGMRLL